MTSDDQQFLDLLASIPQDVAHYGGRVADYIEKHTNSIATEIRDALDHATWLPESLKPVRTNGGPAHFFARPPPPPKGLYEKSVAFISKNRTAIAVVVAFAGTTIYLIHRRKKEHARKRRVKKQSNGAKKEIVVLACSTFHDPLTQSLAIDLERRGYVVYVTVSSTEEDSLVQREAKADLRPLWMDLTSTVPNPGVDTHPDLEPIRELLTTSVRSTSPSSSRNGGGSTMSNMTLAGIIVFPGCSGYPTGTLTNLHPSDVVDSINTRLLTPILTVQQFLPLLQRYSNDPKAPSSVVIAYPSIPQSLSPPTQIPETIITSSLSSLATSLRREVRASKSNIIISELKLGNFDLGSVTSSPSSSRTQHHNRSIYSSSDPTDPNSNTSSQMTLTHTPTNTHWHSSQRAALQRSNLSQSPLIKGSSAREFHNAVFDALAPPQSYKLPFPFGNSSSNKFEYTSTKRSQVIFVGQGARIYDIVGAIMPDGLVGWMMGYRARKDERILRDVSLAAATADSNAVEIEMGRSGVVHSSSSQNLPNWGSGSGNGSLGSESGVWEKV